MGTETESVDISKSFFAAPKWKEQITMRGLVVSAVVGFGSLFFIMTHKLNLTVGAGMLGFSVKTWVALACVVACSGLALSGLVSGFFQIALGAGVGVTGQRPAEAQSRPNANTTNTPQQSEEDQPNIQNIKGLTNQTGTVKGQYNGLINLGTFETPSLGRTGFVYKIFQLAVGAFVGAANTPKQSEEGIHKGTIQNITGLTNQTGLVVGNGNGTINLGTIQTRSRTGIL